MNKKVVKHPHFENAPIVEAVLDILVELPSNVNLDQIEKYHSLVEKKYPVKKKRIKFGGKIEFSSNTIIPAKKEIFGFLFENKEEHKIVQARLDGFSFNKLKPYEEWNNFKTEAKDLWKKYCSLFKPKRIRRVALRYINEIKIPLPIRDFKDYILTMPDISPELPQGLSNYFMRLTIPDEKISANAVITETFKQPKNEKLPFILDIDVFKVIDYNINDTQLWELFEKLRIYKNKVFLNSITSKTKELIK